MLDKDTWVAQNIFPKNTVDQSRRLRNNVKPVKVFKATRKTSLTICVLGSWAIYMPPYNIARLSGLVREAGYLTRVYDFNVESHYALKEANPDLKDAWNGANYWWWQDQEYYKRIHPTYEPILKNYLEILLADNPTILGFSCYYTNMLATNWMIKQVRERRPDITIILGGPECHERYFVLPKEADYYFIGESEQNILDFLNNWENDIKPSKKSIGSLYSDTRIDVDSLPYPDYSDFDLEKYWGRNAICAEFSRGCIAKCSYCTEVYYWKFRDRGAHTLVDELEYQVNNYNVTFVSFVDSLMNGNLKEFRKFCEELIKRNLGISWWGYARCDGRMDKEYYELMAKAGCHGFNYGIETGSDKVLKLINKKNTVAEINQNIIDSHAVGMKINACWVIGAPGEDVEAFTHSFNMLWNHRERIAACSPGPGLGDNMGSDYDNREKYNISPRGKPWLGGWYTLDLTNTRLHRFIRIKLMHIWLKICKDYGGTIINVHASQGDITDHYELSFDSELLRNHVEYEEYDYNIIKSGKGIFADSVMNEVFGFLRMLWRVRGGFEITLNFNEELDHRDFIFVVVPDTHSYTASIWFKIDDDGNYNTKQTYNFINSYKNFVNIDGFTYEYISSGQWTESKKPVVSRILYTEPDPYSFVLPVESNFSSLSLSERKLILRLSKKLSPNSFVLDATPTLGGRASIVSFSNKTAKIFAIDSFNSKVKDEFESTLEWIEEQIIQSCEQLNKEKSTGIDMLNLVKESFVIDTTGRKAFEVISKNYPNICLINSDQELFNVDLCLVEYNLEKINNLCNYINENGFMVVYYYNEGNLLPQNWKIIDSIDTTIVIQKQD